MRYESTLKGALAYSLVMRYDHYNVFSSVLLSTCASIFPHHQQHSWLPVNICSYYPRSVSDTKRHDIVSSSQHTSSASGSHRIVPFRILAEVMEMRSRNSDAGTNERIYTQASTHTLDKYDVCTNQFPFHI